MRAVLICDNIQNFGSSEMIFDTWNKMIAVMQVQAQIVMKDA